MLALVLLLRACTRVAQMNSCRSSPQVNGACSCTHRCQHYIFSTQLAQQSLYLTCTVERSDEEDAYGRRFCRVCRVIQPLRSKHCLSCKRCIHVFDHHCPYFGVCIGERNHGFFFLFLLSTSIMAIYTTQVKTIGKSLLMDCSLLS